MYCPLRHYVELGLKPDASLTRLDRLLAFITRVNRGPQLSVIQNTVFLNLQFTNIGLCPRVFIGGELSPASTPAKIGLGGSQHGLEKW
jgi:hypothetical protein